MPARPIQRVLQTTAITEGAGVTVNRSIGTPALRHFDPFLMLDFFSSDDPNEYIAGFPDHPHRGFVTFTYMLDGHMLHQDSMGNKGDLRSGGAQWMKAASGVIHSEMPQQSAGLMRGFQLWINLPAAVKMTSPAYQEFKPEAFPVLNTGDVTIKILSGSFFGARGPVQDPHTDVHYADVSIAPGGEFRHAMDQAFSAFIYLFEGEMVVGDTAVTRHSLAQLGQGDEVVVRAGGKGARLILVGGKPLQEPVVQYGPFVMNTEQEIREAFREYQNGSLVRQKADFFDA